MNMLTTLRPAARARRQTDNPFVRRTPVAIAILAAITFSLLTVPAVQADCADYENSMHWVYGQSFWYYIPGGYYPWGTFDVAQAGTKILVADSPSGLIAYEENAPGQVVQRDAYLMDAIGVAAVGDRAYVLGQPHGFSVFNTADPSNLTLMTTLEIPSAQRITVAGSYAYLVASGEITIVHIHEPGIIAVVGHLPGDNFGVAVRDNRAYVVTPQGLKVADVTDPAHPVYLQTAYASANLRDIVAQDNFLYVADSAYGLRIFDLADPDQPALVAGAPASQVSRIVVGGSRALLGRQDGITYVDVQDPTSPLVRGTYRGIFLGGGAIQGDFAFLADSFYGLQILDLASGSLPSPIASLPGVRGVDLHLNGGTLALLSTTALRTLDVSDPATPVPLGTLALTYSSCMAAQGDYAYVADNANSALLVVDLSVPAAPTVVATVPGIYVTSVVASGNRVYAVESQSGRLWILDVENPAAPAVLATATILSFAEVGAVLGTSLFTYGNFEGHGTLDQWDVSDPAHVQLLDESFLDSITDIGIAGDHLMVAAARELYAIDPDESWPYQGLGSHSFDGEVAVGSSGRVYTANNRGGFNVFSYDGALHYLGSGAVPSGTTTRSGIAEVSGYLYVTGRDGLYVYDPACAPAAIDEAILETDQESLSSAPNPFRSETAIRIDMPGRAMVDLRVFDATGRLVRTLMSGSPLESGPRSVRWDGRDNQGRDVCAGVYFARLATPTWGWTRQVERLR